jgi:lipoprotein-anchoring transpeptidase ErfK/SrfK
MQNTLLLKSSFVLFAAAFLCAGSSCSSTRPPSAPLAADDSYWHGDERSGAPSVRISLSRQRAYFYKDGQLVGESAISSGREGLDTVTGSFHIIQKDANHQSSLFGDYVDAEGAVLQKDVNTSKDPKPKGAHLDGAKMPNFMRIVNGTGMHEGYLPGYPASHGCIRMPDYMAAAFFRSVTVGTPVSIEL